MTYRQLTIRYSPYTCDVDPEVIWSHVQASGGHIAIRGDACDFTCDPATATLVLLMDPALKIVERWI